MFKIIDAKSDDNDLINNDINLKFKSNVNVNHLKKNL